MTASATFGRVGVPELDFLKSTVQEMWYLGACKCKRNSIRLGNPEQVGLVIGICIPEGYLEDAVIGHFSTPGIYHFIQNDSIKYFGNNFNFPLFQSLLRMTFAPIVREAEIPQKLMSSRELMMLS